MMQKSARDSPAAQQQGLNQNIDKLDFIKMS
jgi:hypothetical protein